VSGELELIDFKNEINMFAQSLSKAIGLDLTVVDENLVRLAGTGEYKNLVGERLENDTMFDYLMKSSNQPYIMECKSEDKQCSICREYNKKRYNRCLVKSQIAAPIVINGNNSGVVSLQAFDEKRKNLINYQKENYIELLNIIRSWLVTRYNTFVNWHDLCNLTNYIDVPALFVSQEGNISFANYYGHKMFGSKGDIEGKHINNFVEQRNLLNMLNQSIKQLDIDIKSDNHSKSASCRVIPVRADDNKNHYTLLFNNTTQTTEKRAFNNTNLYTFDDIIYTSKSIDQCIQIAQKAAFVDYPVLLDGETGTGKEIFATAIHVEGKGYHSPFVAVNCSAIPENLLESELFGYESGAFSGAKKKGHMGKFEVADGGTLLLDEIDSMPLSLQAKILRVLESGYIEKIGSTKTQKINVRIISATNKDLFELVEEGLFREDLYYRLCVIPIKIPPLKERPEDIPLFIDYFVGQHEGPNNISFSEKALEKLKSYHWPGNVRELKNTLLYCLTMLNSKTIETDDLSLKHNHSLKTLKELEKEHFSKAVKVFGTSEEGKQQIAKYLGISRASVYRKLKEYEVRDN